MSTSNLNQPSLPTDAPWKTPWPASELERVSTCPVCGSAARKVLHENLIDNVFFCAPGKWTSWHCSNCSCAYLDPRPTAKSMHLAYKTYYTHKKEMHPAENLHGLRWLNRVMSNGYKNWRFGTNYKPATILGVLAAFILSSKRALINRQFRHLPPPPLGGRVLDVGFGDGGFLENAREIGWTVMGVDTDPEVVRNARQRGLNVFQGTVETLAEEDHSFDVITLNHVIEHVHEPMIVINACYRLLKPGGIIWLETPNIKSIGHARFKNNWRGLEPPRHLVIFDDQSLRMALYKAGFIDIEVIRQSNICYGMYALSSRMVDGLDPNVDRPISVKLRLEIAIARFAEMFLKSRREFLAVTAIKPQK